MFSILKAKMFNDAISSYKTENLIKDIKKKDAI